MKIHQDDIELGTKIYRYRIDTENGEYKLLCKVGTVEKNIARWGINDPAVYDRGKKLVFDSGDPVYFIRFDDACVPLDEYSNGRVFLLEDNPQRAMELFIKFEEDKIEELYAEINQRKEKLDKFKEM